MLKGLTERPDYHRIAETQEQLLEALANRQACGGGTDERQCCLAMNWAKDHAAAFLEAWYPGEAGGEATFADILTGKTNVRTAAGDLLFIR